jgi:beta-lactamase regulating signal transducer with metallopeptidase domain
MMSALADLYPGHRVLDFCVIVAAVVALISSTAWGVSWLLKRRPAARHCVLLSALVASLASPFLVFAFVGSGRSFMNVPLVLTQDDSVPSPGMPKELETSGDVPPGGKLPVVIEPESVVPEHRAAAAVAEQLPPNNSVVVEPKPPAVDSVIGRAHTFRLVVVGVLLTWFCGTVVVILGAMRSWIFLQRLRRSVQPISAASQLRALDEARRLLGARSSPAVGVSRLARAPLAAGAFRPVVILPHDLPAAINEDQLRDILMHEIAHIERRDNLVVVLQLIAKALFWPIPSIHLLNRELETAREEICDNHVLVCRDAVSYGETLLRVAQLACCGAMPAGTVGILHWRGKLEDRISGLIHKGRNTMTRMHPLIALGVLALFLSASAFLCGTSIVAAQQPKADDARKSESTDKDSPAPEIVPGVTIGEGGAATTGEDQPEAAKKDDVRVLLAVTGRAHSTTVPLHVIIENISHKPQSHFEERNSWGYANVTVEWTDASGKSGTVAKVPAIFTVNFPSTVTLQPGEALVRKISFEPHLWQGWPEIPKGTKLRLKVSYQTAPDPKYPSWTGKVSSPEQTVLFR